MTSTVYKSTGVGSALQVDTIVTIVTTVTMVTIVTIVTMALFTIVTIVTMITMLTMIYRGTEVDLLYGEGVIERIVSLRFPKVYST